jgi:hypothetical protein
MKNNPKLKLVLASLILSIKMGTIWGNNAKPPYIVGSEVQLIRNDKQVTENATKEAMKVSFQKIGLSEAIKLSELERKPIFILFNFNDTVKAENQDLMLATNDSLIAMINSHFINIQLNKQDIAAETLKAKLGLNDITKYLFWTPADSSILELYSNASDATFLDYTHSVAYHKKYYDLLFAEPDNQNYLYKTYSFMNKAETEKVKALIDSVNVAAINANDTILRYEFYNNCYWAFLDWKSQTFLTLLQAKNPQKANYFTESDTVSNFEQETISLYAYFLTTNIPYVDYPTNETLWKEYESKMDLILSSPTIDVQDFIDEYYFQLFNRVNENNLPQLNQFLEKIALKFNAGNYYMSEPRLFNLLFGASYKTTDEMLCTMLKSMAINKKTAYHQMQFAELYRFKKQTQEAQRIENVVLVTIGEVEYQKLALLVHQEFNSVASFWYEQEVNK